VFFEMIDQAQTCETPRERALALEFRRVHPQLRTGLRPCAEGVGGLADMERI
jgi:hypothetical protein